MEYPTHIRAFLDKFGLSNEELVRGRVHYSAFYDQLIFPYYARGGGGRLGCIQARNFNPDRAAKAKYFNQGSAKDVLPIFKCPKGESSHKLVITEDALSAIKIARQRDAIPCLGTYMPKDKIVALAALYDSVAVWLDSDKWKEAREMADAFSYLGLSTTTIYSELDPKCYSNEEIKEYIS